MGKVSQKLLLLVYFYNPIPEPSRKAVMKTLAIISIIIVVFLSSCNNPLSKTFHLVSFKQDIQEIRESGKMNEEDIMMLTKFIIRSRIQGNDPEGKTYEDILDNMKSLNERYDASKKQISNLVTLKKLHLSPLVKVELLKKEYTKIKNDEYLLYTVSFTNLTRSNIRTVVGIFSFQDILDKEIEHLNVFCKQGLHSGNSISEKYSVKYNPQNDNDNWMRTKRLADIKIEWIPDKIIYADGKLAE